MQNRYEQAVMTYIENNWQKLLREPKGILRHRMIVPGACYEYSLWDWDSWLTDIAITPIVCRQGRLEEFWPYQIGCILNFCDHMDKETGWMPIMIDPDGYLPKKENASETNSAKPVLVQHALFIANAHRKWEWLRDIYPKLVQYLQYYKSHCKHESGLFYFVDDTCIGVDNDPCTYFRPKRSSASIFLNCLMYRELQAMAEISQALGFNGDQYNKEAEQLKQSICDHCYDERNGFYYSVDIDLLPVNPNQWLHSGFPRNWTTLQRRIDVWSGFLAMWAGIADEAQAERMVRENLENERTFGAPWGVRTLSKCEKMYQIVPSGNPSCWLGPIWGVSNYFVFAGLQRYGYNVEAMTLADKTIALFGRDIEQNGQMHEYYHPESGEGVYNPGFQSWNLLCAQMIQWKQDRNLL